MLIGGLCVDALRYFYVLLAGPILPYDYFATNLRCFTFLKFFIYTFRRYRTYSTALTFEFNFKFTTNFELQTCLIVPLLNNVVKHFMPHLGSTGYQQQQKHGQLEFHSALCAYRHHDKDVDAVPFLEFSGPDAKRIRVRSIKSNDKMSPSSLNFLYIDDIDE